MGFDEILYNDIKGKQLLWYKYVRRTKNSGMLRKVLIMRKRLFANSTIKKDTKKRSKKEN